MKLIRAGERCFFIRLTIIQDSGSDLHLPRNKAGSRRNRQRKGLEQEKVGKTGKGEEVMVCLRTSDG